MDANNLSAFVSSVLSYELGGVSKALDAMSPKDVNQASKFLDVFNNEILCKQILARLFSKFEAAFDLNFSFRTCSQLENSNRATARLDVDVTSKLAGSWHQLAYVYGVQVNAWEMDVRLEQKRLLVYAKCLLLANLFSDHFTTFTVKLDFMRPSTQFAEFVDQADLIIPLRVKEQRCFTSMLESLLADGYDLAALQQFLVV